MISSKSSKILFLTGILIIGGFLLLPVMASADYTSCYTACPQEYQGAQIQECVNNCAALYPEDSGLGATGGEGTPQLPTGGEGTPERATGGGGSASLPNFLGVGSISELILKIINFLIILAIPFAVLMLVWAGFQFATAQGSEEKLTKAKKNLLWTVAGIAVILASQAIVSYITEILGGTTGQANALVTKIKGVIQQVIGFLFLLVTVYFFWGITEFVRATGDGDTAKIETGKQHMIWGIVGMAVMLGAWAIVGMLQSFFK